MPNRGVASLFGRSRDSDVNRRQRKNHDACPPTDRTRAERRTGNMNGGERDCECAKITADIMRHVAQELRELEGPNSEVFDLADELVIRGPSGEVERCLDGIRKGIDRHTDTIDTLLQRDAVRCREWTSTWEERWMAKMKEMKEMREKEEQERQMAEILARIQAVHQRLEAKHGGWFRAILESRPSLKLLEEEPETLIPLVLQHVSLEDFIRIQFHGEVVDEAFSAMELAKTVVDKARESLSAAKNAYRVVQNSERLMNDLPAESIAATLKFRAATKLVLAERALAAAAAKGPERVSEATPPPVNATDSTDANDASQRAPPPETSSARRFGDDGSGSVSVAFGDERVDVERSADGYVSVAEGRDEGSPAAEETREEDAGPAAGHESGDEKKSDVGREPSAEKPALIVVQEVRAESPTQKSVLAEPRPSPRRAVSPPPRDREQARLGDTSRNRAVGGFRGFVFFVARRFSRAATALAELFAIKKKSFPTRIEGKK